MRLRTELVTKRGRTRAWLPKGYVHKVGSSEISPIDHDLLAAHALLQAIADWHEKNGTDADADVYPETTVAFIEKRAAEILAGWLGEDRG